MASSAESSFRQQFSSWNSRPGNAASTSGNSNGSGIGLNDLSMANITNKLQSINPFKGGGGYMQLPIAENGQMSGVQEPSWFNLSRWDRLVCFGICIVISAAIYALCFALFPVLVLRPTKFAILWSLASLLFVISFGCLQGPVNYIVHLTSVNRLPFTVIYFGSIVLTLVFSLGLRSPILTIISCAVQIVAAIWYAVSYFPWGTNGLRLASRLGFRQVNSWLDS
ncbi:Got1/Sft2-like family-domain-containing protein [Dipodascopsis uninucleata]